MVLPDREKDSECRSREAVLGVHTVLHLGVGVTVLFTKREWGPGAGPEGLLWELLLEPVRTAQVSRRLHRWVAPALGGLARDWDGSLAKPRTGSGRRGGT